MDGSILFENLQPENIDQRLADVVQLYAERLTAAIGKGPLPPQDRAQLTRMVAVIKSEL